MHLLTAQDVADLLRLPSPKSAKNTMRRLGVQPYDLGRGRSLGLRWDKSEVMEALEQSRGEGKRQPKRRDVQAEFDSFAQNFKQLLKC